jgi:hypothetical protein
MLVVISAETTPASSFLKVLGCRAERESSAPGIILREAKKS